MADEAGSAMEKAGAWLATGFVILTAALGAIGATGGGVDRMFRNFQGPARFAFIAVGLSIALAGFSMIFPGVGLRRLLLALGILLFSAGLVLALALASVVPTTKEQPTVTAKLVETGGQLSLEATVKAAGLRSNEIFRVAVDGIPGDNETLERLYLAEMGPDPAGKIDITLQISLPPAGTFDEIGVAAGLKDLRDKCFEEDTEGRNESGCLVLAFPEPEPEPSPTATAPPPED